MAKSKNGGTRAMIRGRVGADVYSIGKDGKGTKQQVVRSLAETVANPQTELQMKGRMIMSTVMQAVSALSVLVDHSFDGYPNGQPSISEFIRTNYALVKADVAANPSSGNAFGINKYQEKGAKNGAYVVSNGKQTLPSAIANAAAGMVITASGDSLTLGAVRTALGLDADEYVTLMGLSTDGALEFTRIKLSTSLADTTVITSENVNAALGLESVGTPSVSISGMAITIALANAQANSAVIISKKVNGSYEHNKAVLLTPSDPDFTADVALATYPIGQEMILNGGNFNGGGSVTPVSPTYNPAITGVTKNGVASAKGTAISILGNSSPYTAPLVMNVDDLDPSKAYAMVLNPSDASFEADEPFGGQAVTISNGSATINQWVNTDNGTYYLMLAEKQTSGSFTHYIKIETWAQVTVDVNEAG